MTNEEFQALVLRQLQALTEGQSRMESDIDSLKLGQAKLEENQLKFEANQLKLEENQLKLEANQLKLETNIENKVVEKIRGLYDDREVQNDRFDRIEEKLEDIAVDTSYLVAKVAKLERIAK